ncbi:DegV family protein [Caproiciproducens sp. NJN-50]|uniref:DegV family protein n=1 Tax=Acutalibacteraceae TaxID=3082771 RepID=UPI000FFE083E|nr:MULTISPECIES: DegV family protein [Acutalibacteraceae]QAT51058.1 DegV family protein [Caproiciproducens sp. NJN-50]
MAVLISADSACDLFPDLYRQRGISIVPLSINIGDQSYKDVFEIGPDELFDDYERTRRLPKTAAPPPVDFFEVFRKAAENGDSVVHLAMNSKFSSSYQNACIAAKEFENVHVINTYTLSSAQGLLVLRAADMRDAGLPADEISARIEQDKERVRAYVLLDTLEFAYRGGRATMLQMFGANLLKLRPCLLLDNQGELSVCKKFRGNFRQVCKEYARFVLSQPNPDGERAFVTTTGMDQELFGEITDLVRESGRFREVLNSRAGCAMTTHTGPNTLVIFYLEK